MININHIITGSLLISFIIGVYLYLKPTKKIQQDKTEKIKFKKKMKNMVKLSSQ